MQTRWRYIADDGVSAHRGLATDEVLMRPYQEPQPAAGGTLRLYTYRSHCALVGRFQHLEAEINREACEALDVQIGRRMTGGGAIIMGRDQLGICLTTAVKHLPPNLNQRHLYAFLAQPIIDGLSKLGIDAAFRPKNDLEVNGRKIAGLGIYTDARGALLFHTSLLVDLDVDLMIRVLNIPREKIADKVLIRSVRQRMTTIRRELGTAISLDEVRDILKQSFARYFQCTFQETPLTVEEEQAVQQLMEQKYQTPQWLFQFSPQQDLYGAAVRKTPAGLLRVYVALFGETIKSVMITGDFLEQLPFFTAVESALKWHPLDRETIQHTITEISRRHPTNDVDPRLLAATVWEAVRRARMESHFTYRGTCYYPKKESQTITRQEAGG